MAHSAGDVDGTSALSDDPKHRGEAKAGALPLSFCGEEWFKDMGLCLAVHATTGVANNQPDIVTWRQRSEVVDRTAGQFDLGRFNRERSTLRHGIPCIDDEIDQHLFKLSLVSAQSPVLRIESAYKLDVLADEAAQQTLQTRDSGVERQNFRIQRLFTAEREQLPNQRRGPIAGLQCLFDLSTKRMLRAEFRQEDLTITHDDGQEIIEVVRNPSSQPANRFHFLGLPKLFLALPKGFFRTFPFRAVIDFT